MQLPSARFTSADQFQRQRLIVGPKSTYWLLFSDQAQDVAALVAVNDADSALEGSGALAVPRRLTAADRSALHDLLLAHFDFIWRSLRRLGVPEDSVDDAAQQVFVVASRKIDRDPPRAEEVAALDRVRHAVEVHDAARALELLRAYQKRFPRGYLGREASLLRIETLIESEQREVAVAAGRKFLASDATGPSADKVRRIISEANP
jgi:hypothetical protein